MTRTPIHVEAQTAFVEVADGGQGHMTYSALLDERLCEEIDRRAYLTARTWYLEDGRDTTEVAGVSLGRAFELPATVILVRLFRAKAVLAAIAGRDPIALAGVGPEWEFAAQELGKPVIRLFGEPEPTGLAVPDPMLHPPDRVRRAAARLVSGSSSSARNLAFLGTPAWAQPYVQAMPQRDLEVINPGRRLLLRSLAAQHRPVFSWLSDMLAATREGIQPNLGPAILRETFKAQSSRMAALAGARRLRQRRVWVATEDVSPGARVAALATLAAGGRVVTLEHGISGMFREQIHSVATVLGVWGEPQARYHREAGAPGQTVLPIGWPRLATRGIAPDQNAPFDIVYFGQPVASLSAANWPEDALDAARMVGSYAECHPARRVAWKPHAGSDAYGGAYDPGPQVRRVTGDSLELIAQSRVVAVTSSTTGIEAMALGRPVIQLAARGKPGGTDFVGQSGAATRASSPDDFDHAAEHLLRDRNARQRAVDAGRAYADTFITGFSVRGQAERRLIEVVMDLAAGLE